MGSKPRFVDTPQESMLPVDVWEHWIGIERREMRFKVRSTEELYQACQELSKGFLLDGSLIHHCSTDSANTTTVQFVVPPCLYRSLVVLRYVFTYIQYMIIYKYVCLQSLSHYHGMLVKWRRLMRTSKRFPLTRVGYLRAWRTVTPCAEPQVPSEVLPSTCPSLPRLENVGDLKIRNLRRFGTLHDSTESLEPMQFYVGIQRVKLAGGVLGKDLGPHLRSHRVHPICSEIMDASWRS